MDIHDWIIDTHIRIMDIHNFPNWFVDIGASIKDIHD